MGNLNGFVLLLPGHHPVSVKVDVQPPVDKRDIQPLECGDRVREKYMPAALNILLLVFPGVHVSPHAKSVVLGKIHLGDSQHALA